MSAELRTNIQAVLDYATSLKGPLPPNRVIGDVTGLTPSQVERAIGHIRNRKNTPVVFIYDGSYARRNQAISLAKGNIWPDVEPYAVLGMRAREIRQALILEKDRDIREASINCALIHRRKKGQLSEVTTEERDNVRRTVMHGTDKKIKGRVRTWLGIRDLLRFSAIETANYRRMDWMRLIDLAPFILPMVESMEREVEPAQLRLPEKTKEESRLADPIFFLQLLCNQYLVIENAEGSMHPNLTLQKLEKVELSYQRIQQAGFILSDQFLNQLDAIRRNLDRRLEGLGKKTVNKRADKDRGITYSDYFRGGMYYVILLTQYPDKAGELIGSLSSAGKEEIIEEALSNDKTVDKLSRWDKIFRSYIDQFKEIGNSKKPV